MTESTSTAKKRNREAASDGTVPVAIIREGAIAASIWKRQSPSGFAYYDFTLSRSWKSMGSGKSGYSKSFFEANQCELVAVIQRTSEWLAARPPEQPSEGAALDSIVN